MNKSVIRQFSIEFHPQFSPIRIVNENNFHLPIDSGNGLLYNPTCNDNNYHI